MKITDYKTPSFRRVSVKIEQGFATSDPNWGNGTPGGVIDENNYGSEL